MEMILKKENMKISFLGLSLIVSIICLIVFVVQNLFQVEIEIIKRELILLFMFFFLLSFKVNIFYSIFLFNFFLFNLSRIVLDLLKYKNFYEARYFAYYDFSLKTQYDILYNLILTLLLVNIVILVLIKILKLKNFNYDFKKNLTYLKIGKYLMIIFYFGAVIKKIKETLLIIKNGYLTMYTGGLQTVASNPYEKISMTFFLLGFFIYLGGKPEKKRYCIASFFFLSLKLIESLKGNRSQLILTFQVLLVIYIYMYGKIKLKNMFKVTVALTFFAALLGNLRVGHKILSLKSTIIDFFYQQGVTMTILGFTIDNKEMLIEKSNFFGPLIGIINSYRYRSIFVKGQTEDFFNLTPSLTSMLTINLNKNAALQGMGLGGSFVSELYIVNIIVKIVILFLFFGFFFVILKKSSKNNIAPLLTYYILDHLFWLPRENFMRFNNFEMILRILLTYLFFILIYTILKKRRKKNETSINFNSCI